MISKTLNEISKIVNGRLIGPDKLINNISINSKIIGNNCLFIAFKGSKYDSYEFVDNAIKNGAIAILASIYNNKLNVSQILVNDVNYSFFMIGKWIRSLSKACIIAITGSCGKTSVKEMVVKILNNIGKVSYTIRNQNNIIGVNLTLLNIEIDDKFVVIELGTDGLKQISQSVFLVKPDVILINNLFISHFLKLKNLNNLSYAKGEILENISNNCRLILNFDNNNWNYWKFLSFIKNPLFFSINKLNKTDFYISNLELFCLNSNFILNTPIGNIKINLNLPGIHNIYNAIASSAISIVVGAKLKDVSIGLSKFSSVNQRLFPLFINKNKIILDDTYNANIGSLISSCKVLEKMPGYKTLIIGDMNELGNSEIFLHKKIGYLIKSLKINKILSLGNLSYFITLNNVKGEHFKNELELVNKIIKLILNKFKISILVKASRKNNFDHIIENIFLKIKNDNITFT